MPLRLRAPRDLRRAPVVAAVLVLLVLAGCSGAKHQAEVTPPSSPTGTEDVPAELASFYEQQLEWTECGEFDCATAQVPIDYADPEAGSVGLALKRYAATGGDPIGSVLINPGGPGVSGVDFVEVAPERFGKDLVREYDIVGFDPRGAARSEPIECVDDPQMDALVSTDFDYATDEGIQEAKDAYGEFGAGCEERSGELLAHVDTISVARDLDVLRAALGDETLAYMGFSYGTELGATYAELFPQRVGRLVLDGALDPTLSNEELNVGQAAGFESALRAYIADCQAGRDCPLSGDLDDGLGQVSDLLERATRTPLPTGTDRRLTGQLAFTGIAQALYDNEFWPYLTQALTAALRENDGSVLLAFADIYNGREPDGTFDSILPTFWSVGCLDGPSDPDVAVMRAEAKEIEEVAPTVGLYFSYSGKVCAQWPVPPVGDLDSYDAEGAPPILVIGTTNDPATPYAWAESLASTLSSGELLTYEGEGHTAYGRSNDCIIEAVDAFMLAGTVPAEGTRC